MIGRDTVFTLCDGTDRAIIRVDDLTRVGSALVSDNLVITCTNDRSTVTLKVGTTSSAETSFGRR
jgi:hypothetical protein